MHVQGRDEDGNVVELDQATLGALSAGARERLAPEITSLVAESGVGAPVDFALYRMGSAFLRIRDES